MTTPPSPPRCARCGKLLAGSGCLIAAWLEQPDGTIICASDCTGGNYPPEIQDRIDYGRYLRGQDDAS